MTDRSPRARRARDDGFVGRGLERREDERLLRGAAEFTDDLTAPDLAHAAFVRSQYGHATVERVDTAPAEAIDGVAGAFTWEDVAASGAPGTVPVDADSLDTDPPGHPVLARERVRYQGQPVAVVVAEDRYRAHDAADAVDVEYDRRDAVTDPVAATDEDAPTLFEGIPDNVATGFERGDRAATDRAFEGAAHVVDLDLANNRLIPNAMEPRAVLAEYDDRLAVTMTSQNPHEHRRELAATLGVPERRIRVRAPDVGGGFGHKHHHYPGEAVAAWCAMQLGRPVKWTATRTENYLAGAHGRDRRTRAELALDADGRFRGLRVDATLAVGGYAVGHSPLLPGWMSVLQAGQYEIPAVHCRFRSVFTNTAPVHAYRGAGRPETIYTLERLVDAAARELGVDPVDLRRRNQVPPDDFPHETAAGATYDSGDYGRALDAAVGAVDYHRLRDADRENGRYVGVGVACFVENTGGGFESGVVRVHGDGGVTVYAGTHSHGQGHDTTYAQVVADELGVPMDEVAVVEGDTDRIPEGTGTFASRSTVVGGSAVAESARAVREKAERIAADRLEVSPADLEVSAGEFHVVGAPERSVTLGDVAGAAYGGPRPEGVDAGLETTTFYDDGGDAYSFGTHVAVVGVDPETGEVDVERYVAVDDCGERVNPRLVEGQVHGGVAQGVGQARYEQAVYDDNGQLVTGSMQDYAVPRADQLPEIETEATVTPSPHNPLGAKGIGEAGTIAAPPAVVNAVVDALAPLGVDHVDMPLTAERVWRAIRDA